jgi:hypothetical protein
VRVSGSAPSASRSSKYSGSRAVMFATLMPTAAVSRSVNPIGASSTSMVIEYGSEKSVLAVCV